MDLIDQIGMATEASRYAKDLKLDVPGDDIVQDVAAAMWVLNGEQDLNEQINDPRLNSDMAHFYQRATMDLAGLV